VRVTAGPHSRWAAKNGPFVLFPSDSLAEMHYVADDKDMQVGLRRRTDSG